jgi:hypothetical protein
MSKFGVIWVLETVPDLAAYDRMCANPRCLMQRPRTVWGKVRQALQKHRVPTPLM